MTRRGDFMITFTGRAFWPLDPRADEVDVEDIASGLANQGRYSGQGRHFYSIAQHSVELARWFMAKGDVPLARWALMHDDAEAYIGDIIRPIKPELPDYAAIERGVEAAIWQRFELGDGVPPPVKDADKRIAVDEMIALFPADALARHGIAQRARLGLSIRPLYPTIARDAFLATFRELFE